MVVPGINASACSLRCNSAKQDVLATCSQFQQIKGFLLGNVAFSSCMQVHLFQAPADVKSALS